MIGTMLRGARKTLLGLALAAGLVACGGRAVSASTVAQDPPGAVSAAYQARPVPPGDWLRFDYDAQRSGVGPADTGINAGNLRYLRARVVHLSGVADSSPVELHAVLVAGRVRDVVFVTTTYGKTLAIDASTGQLLWQYVPGDIGTYAGSAQITTASPIIDPDRAHIYASSPNGRIHKLAVATGAEVRSGIWPVRVTFDPTREKIASALNISGNSLLVTTGGYYGDAPPYQGHVVLIDRASGAILHVWNSLCSGRHQLIVPSSCPASDSAIWARAGAVVEPGSGRILVATGNGPFNGSTNWGDSVLELSADAARLLHNWTPRNQAQLHATDTDVGSSAPALLVGIRGYRLAVQGGKDGQLHLLNLNRLDGTRAGAGGRLGGAIQNISTPGGGELFTAPAVWMHGGREHVFVADSSGLAAYVLRVGAHPALRLVWKNGASGTSPVIAGGLLYVYDQQGGRLNVYGPGSGRLLRSLPAAPGHWSSPIVVGGRIILPTGGSTANNVSRSSLFIYHLPGL
jgi:outer membrane protein assembly factor BamB